MSKNPQQRKEPLSLRIEPKIKYMIEIASRVQRRNISNYVEYALEESLKNLAISENKSVYDATIELWSPSEAQRVINLYLKQPMLLTFEEEKIISVIKHFYNSLNNNENSLDMYEIENDWEIIKLASFGDREIEARAWLTNKAHFISLDENAIRDILKPEINEVKIILEHVINKKKPSKINEVMLSKTLEHFLYLFIKDDKAAITINNIDLNFLRLSWGVITAASYYSEIGHELLASREKLLSYVEKIKE